MDTARYGARAALLSSMQVALLEQAAQERCRAGQEVARIAQTTYLWWHFYNDRQTDDTNGDDCRSIALLNGVTQ